MQLVEQRVVGLKRHSAKARHEFLRAQRFEFEHLVVRPTLPQGRSGVKVAFDGEVAHLRLPLEFRVAGFDPGNPLVARVLMVTVPGLDPTACAALTRRFIQT